MAIVVAIVVVAVIAVIALFDDYFGLRVLDNDLGFFVVVANIECLLATSGREGYVSKWFTCLRPRRSVSPRLAWT
jgi:hypothetical protein